MGWSHSPPQTPIFRDFSWRGTSSLLWEQLTQSRPGKGDPVRGEAWECLQDFS